MKPDEDFGQRLRTCRWGVLLSLLTILFGFGMGELFGAFESSLEGGLSARAEAVRDSVYAGDAAKMKSILDKSWTYYKRAHLHGGALGAAVLGAIVLLASLRRPSAGVRRGIALATGLGGLGYPLFWMLAARRAPALGSTDLAKESLSWLAIPSAGLAWCSECPPCWSWRRSSCSRRRARGALTPSSSTTGSRAASRPQTVLYSSARPQGASPEWGLGVSTVLPDFHKADGARRGY